MVRPPENAKCVNTEHHFPILRPEIAVVAKEQSELFPAENKRQEGSRGRWMHWGQRKQSSFLQSNEETSLFRAFAIENADPGGRKELTDLSQTG